MALSKQEEKQRHYAKRKLITRANRVLGICEVLRLIYDEVADLENKEKITELLIDATIMAKKMDDRLKYYQTTYNDTTGHGGKNLKRIYGSRDRDVMRRKRTI